MALHERGEERSVPLAREQWVRRSHAGSRVDPVRPPCNILKGLNGALLCNVASALTCHCGSTEPPPSTPPSCRRNLPRTAPRRTRSAASTAAMAKVSKPASFPRLAARGAMSRSARPTSTSSNATSAFKRSESGMSNRAAPALTSFAVANARRSLSVCTISTLSRSTPRSSSQRVKRRVNQSCPAADIPPEGTSFHSGIGSGLAGCSTFATRASSLAVSSL